MAQATWHSHSRGYRLTHGFLRGFKPPSEETAFLLAFSCVILAVVILHARGAVKPRPEVSPGIAIEAVALPPVEVPLVAPVNMAPVVPPAPVASPLEDRTAVPAPVTQQAAPSAPLSVRSLDLETLPALDNLVTQTNASFDPQRVTYGDLSGAGEVALVALQSGGSGGTVAAAIVGTGEQGPQVLALLTPDRASRSRLSFELNDGLVVMTQGVLGDEDPLCCPSQTKRSYYAWDGARLQLQREVTTQNVSAKD